MREASRVTCALVWLCVLGVAPIMATGVREQVDTTAEQGQTTLAELMDGAQLVEEAAPHAHGFQVYRTEGYTALQVTKPWPTATEADTLTYILYDRSQAQPLIDGAAAVIPVPVESMATMSTTFLAHLEELDALSRVSAVDSLAFAYSRAIRERADSIVEVGAGPSVDTEQLVALGPDAILVNSFGGEWDAAPTLVDAGLPVVILGDWVETTPLGRANWMVFTAFLVGKEDQAIAVMEEIAGEYQELEEIGRGAEDKPTVLINAPYQGTWSIAGGASYAAQFVADAGGDYVYADDTSTGALFFDVESVFARAGDAEIWINPGTWTSRESAIAEDERYENFAAFADGQLYNYNRRVAESGANDYFESGAIHPHVVLADLIKIFHPELLPDHELHYYQRIE